MKKRRFSFAVCIASALAAVMVLASGTESAWAYFTTNTTAAGSHRLRLESETTTVEEKFSFDDWIKRLTVTNTDASGRAVYVRAIAFSGNYDDLEYPYVGENGTTDWKLGYVDENNVLHTEDRYCYYGNVNVTSRNGVKRYYGGTILEINQSASELQVKIENVPETAESAGDFNVIVVYETAPVQYDEEGNPYADWSVGLERIEEGGSR